MLVCALPLLSAETDAGGAGGGNGRGRRDGDGGCVDRGGRDDHGTSDARGYGHARWQPHDIVRLRRLPTRDGEPVWVREAFLRAPFAVVRRAPPAPGFAVAVGIRGASRAQRYGTWVEESDIEFAMPPETLVAREPGPRRAMLPAFSVLAELRRAPCSLGQFVWGPAGSVGFELATGVPTVNGSSDLDLLIRAPERLDHAAAGRLLAELLALTQRVGVRIDAQLETPAGGVALAELAACKSHVMARANTGASLVNDPWTAAAAVDVAVDVNDSTATAQQNMPSTRSSPPGAQLRDVATVASSGGSTSATPTTLTLPPMCDDGTTTR
jgi:phosphoribosyl-dephospho-CoA transferase